MNSNFKSLPDLTRYDLHQHQVHQNLNTQQQKLSPNNNENNNNRIPQVVKSDPVVNINYNLHQQQNNNKSHDTDLQIQKEAISHYRSIQSANKSLLSDQSSSVSEENSKKSEEQAASNVEVKNETITSNENVPVADQMTANNSSDLTTNSDDVEDAELDELQLYYSQIGIDDDYNADYNELTTFSAFNPCQIEIPKKMAALPNPMNNYYERQLERVVEVKNLSDQSEKLLELFANVDLNSENWLQQCENLVSSRNRVDSFIEIKIKNENSFNRLIKQLIEVVVELINYKYVLKSKTKDQSKQVLKIHQIKLGLQLITFLASSFDEEMCRKLLNKQIQVKLVQLFENESVFVSIKTTILKAIDSTMSYPVGVKEFLCLNNNETSDQQQTPTEASKSTKSAYSRLLSILMSKKSNSTLLNSQIGKILNKLAFYSLVSHFQSKVDKLVDLNKDIKCIANVNFEQFKHVNELYDLFTLIYYMWKNIHKQIAQNENIIKRLPVKALFVNQMLTSEQEEFMIQRLSGQYIETTDACLLFVYRLIAHFKLLKSTITVWSHPIVTQIRVDFLQKIEKFFYDMLFSSESLNYLLLNSNQTSALVKLMMKKHQPGIDESSTMTTNSLTIQLVYSLQTRIYISTLNELYESLPKQTSKFDFYLQILNTLQSLSMFLMNLNTKLALINVFTLSKNIDILINLLKLINSEQNFDNMNENSIKKLLIGSIVDIIFAIFKYNDNNINFFKNYSKPLHEIFSIFQLSDKSATPDAEETKQIAQVLGLKSIQDKLKQIDEYLKPHLKFKLYTHECVSYLVKNLKLFTQETSINSTSSNLSAILSSKTLIQILRMLNYVCVAPSGIENSTTIDSHKYEILSEFNYKRCLGELLSQKNCLDDFFYLLKKLSEYILYTFQNCITLILNEKHQIFTIFKLSLNIVFTILKTHINLRKCAFNNIDCLKTLFSLYNSVYLSFQLDQMYDEMINGSIKMLIFNILNLYMRQSVAAADNEEDDVAMAIDNNDDDCLINKSTDICNNNNLYKSLFRELCKFITDSPCNYLGGLMLFIELLPLPLPIICKYKLNQDKLSSTIRSERLILDFNLSLITTEIRVVLRILSLSTNLQLQQALKRFCIHFADISPNLCSFILKSIFNFIIELVEQASRPVIEQEQMMIDSATNMIVDDPTAAVTQPYPSETMSINVVWPIEVARLMALLSSLISNSTNSSLKIGLLCLITPETPEFPIEDETSRVRTRLNGNGKYRSLITKAINYCLNNDKQLIENNQLILYQHISIQESIFYLIQILCDNNTIYDDPLSTNKHVSLYSQLPDYEILSLIVKLLVDHLNNTKLQNSTITISTIQALVLLCRHDYGYELVISELNSNTNAIYNFINEFNSTILNIRQQNLYDLLNLLTVFYEFIRLLVPPVSPLPSTTLLHSLSMPNMNLFDAVNTTPLENPVEQQIIAAPTQQRTSHVTSKKFKELIKWNPNPKDHPLLNLRILLESFIPKNSANDETTNTQMDVIYSDATNLIGFLRRTDVNPQLNENEKLLFIDSANNYKFVDQRQVNNEINNVENGLLENYYSKRLIFIEDESINNFDDVERYINELSSNSYETPYDDTNELTPTQSQINTSSSVQSPPSDYLNSTALLSSTNELQDDKIEVDLEDLIKTYCPNFDLNSELTKEFGGIIADRQSKVKKPEFINTRTGFRYKAPMRGGHNSGMRGGLLTSYLMMNRTDPFRSRQPNTSRPPSVHVDDFNRLRAQDAAAFSRLNASHNIMNSNEAGAMDHQFLTPFIRNNPNIQTNPSLNTRSRFLMPPEIN